MSSFEHRSIFHQCGATDCMLKFADVAGPAVEGELVVERPRQPNHPVNWPSAARMLLVHACALDAAPERSDMARYLEGLLGSFDPKRLRGAWPSFLGPDDHLRTALQLDDESLESAISRLTANDIGDNSVLRAALG